MEDGLMPNLKLNSHPPPINTKHYKLMQTTRQFVGCLRVSSVPTPIGV